MSTAIALLIAAAGCVEDRLPTAPEYDVGIEAAIVPASVAVQQAHTSIVDAVDRILPTLDEEVAPGLQVAIRQLADVLEQDLPAAEPLLRARAILEAVATRAGPDTAADLDAIGLAVDAVEAAWSVEAGL